MTNIPPILAKLPLSDARQLLVELGQRRVLRELERLRLRQEAEKLLTARLPRSLIRERLQASGVSRRTAQRIIEAVIGRGSPLPRQPGGTEP